MEGEKTIMMNKKCKSVFGFKVFFLFAVLLIISLKGTPVWADSVLTITLNANGGVFPANNFYGERTVRTEDIKLDSSGKNIYSINLGTNGKPEWKGKTLIGWSRNANATNAEYTWQLLEVITSDYYEDPENRKTMPLDGSVTYLYAVWTDTYYITLDANGGDFGTSKDRYGKVTPIETLALEFWYDNGHRCYNSSKPNAIKRNSDEVHKGWSSNKNAVRPEYSTWFDGLVLNSSTPKTLYAIYGKENDKSSDYQDADSAEATDNKKGSASEKGSSKNPLTVKVKTVVVKASKLKKKTQKIATKKAFTIKKAEGGITFKKLSGNKKISINSKTKKITLKKGLKKGTYKVKVKVTAAGNSKYKAGSKTVTLKIKVK